MLRTQVLLAPLILTACAALLGGCSSRPARDAWDDGELPRMADCAQVSLLRAGGTVRDDETLWDLDNTRLPQHVIP